MNREEIKNLYLSGVSAPEIALSLKIKLSAVYRVLRESKLVRAKGRPRHAERDNNDIDEA